MRYVDAAWSSNTTRSKFFTSHPWLPELILPGQIPNSSCSLLMVDARITVAARWHGDPFLQEEITAQGDEWQRPTPDLNSDNSSQSEAALTVANPKEHTMKWSFNLFTNDLIQLLCVSLPFSFSQRNPTYGSHLCLDVRTGRRRSNAFAGNVKRHYSKLWRPILYVRYDLKYGKRTTVLSGSTTARMAYIGIKLDLRQQPSSTAR